MKDYIRELWIVLERLCKRKDLKDFILVWDLIWLKLHPLLLYNLLYTILSKILFSNERKGKGK